MSEDMTRAVIGMPYELAMDSEMSRRQFYARAQALLADLDEARNGMKHSCAIRLKKEIERLEAEGEELRKNADRYEWLRDKSEAVHQFYLSVPLWFTGVRFRAQDVDKAIDAMSKGGQS